MPRTIERIYPYYVKAPSDSNSKPIKQLLSGKNEESGFRAFLNLALVQPLWFASAAFIMLLCSSFFPVTWGLKLHG